MADGNNQDVNNYLAFSGFYGANPYSQYQNSALPMPSYAGMPTNAMGQQIPAPPGTTLNTPPPSAGTPGTPATPGRYAMTNPGGSLPSGENYGSATPTNIPAQYQYMPGTPATPGTPASSGTGPGTLDFQTARSMLANPGPVATPGANGPSPVTQPNVLANFLANNRAGTGAGNYTNAGFFNTLNALKGGTQPGAGAL